MRRANRAPTDLRRTCEVHVPELKLSTTEDTGDAEKNHYGLEPPVLRVPRGGELILDSFKEMNMRHSLAVRFVYVTMVAAVATTCTVAAQQPAASPVTAEDLRDGLKNPTRWLTYGGDYTKHRHRPLTLITPLNVQRLTAQWAFQTDTLGKFDASSM